MNITYPPAAGTTTSPAIAESERTLVALLKLTSAADRVLAGVPAAAAPAQIAQLRTATDEAWDVLGPHRRMGAGGA